MSDSTSHRGLTSIVAVGLNGEIGVRNSLPWNLKSDLRFFKNTTVSNTIIMGRKTYESIGGCLKGRENIVLSHRATLFELHKGCEHAHSIGETLYLAGKHRGKSAFVIGGAVTYAQFSPYVDRYLLTIVNSKFPEADAYFSEQVIGDDANWERREISVERVVGGDEFEFSVIELCHKYPEISAKARSEAISNFIERNHILKRKAFRQQVSRGLKLDPQVSLA